MKVSEGRTSGTDIFKKTEKKWEKTIYVQNVTTINGGSKAC